MKWSDFRHAGLLMVAVACSAAAAASSPEPSSAAASPPLTTSVAAPAAPPPAELFFRKPDFDAARLSPNGRWLAVRLGLANGRFGLAVFDVDGATPPTGVAHFRDTDLGRFSWVNDERIVYDVVDLQRGSGDLVADAEALRAVSPVSPVAQAARLKLPLLLAYGELDRRVPLERGSRLRAALQAAGSDPAYVVYPGEGHSWQRAEHRIDFAHRLERFLAQHLPPQPAAARPATPP
ncbi:MAG: prolyl oligopeptidase family serine peptidase [Rubrivivax sp.]|nr:prolyl oligopeptidase family serine peptidase [Rubrivivax sp.]